MAKGKKMVLLCWAKWPNSTYPMMPPTYLYIVGVTEGTEREGDNQVS